MTKWIQRQFGNLMFWLGLILAGATCIHGYSNIRSSQVRTEAECIALRAELTDVRERLDNLIDMHIRDGGNQQGAWNP